MVSSDGSNEAADGVAQNDHSFNHREFLNERRRNILQQKQTDHLPGIDSEPPSGRIAWRQLIQLREENKRLRWELAETARDIEALQDGHQQETAYLQAQMQSALTSRDSLQDDRNDLELRYQDLYHAFQGAVEEEATKIVDEAARTIELTPGDRPAQVNDVMKTVELRVRQVEDKHVAEVLYLMRQAQRKANRLEYELAQEREQIALQRQNLYSLQNSVREQAELRKRVVEQSLRARYTLSVALITIVLLILLPLMQITLFTLLHVQLSQLSVFLLFAPLLICAVLAVLFAQMRVSTRVSSSGAKPQKSGKNKA